MRLNSNWAWGLAWVGLTVVIAVPSADFLTGKAGTGRAALLTSTTDPVTTASVTTSLRPNGITITPTGSPANPVSSYLKTGKTLPSYISGGTSAAAPNDIATADPAPPEVAPAPFPLPLQFSPKVAASDPTVAEIPADEEPVIVDEQGGPVPPEPIGNDTGGRRMGLQQYLDQNGLLADSSGRSTASVTIVNRSDPDYDPNGFYLSDGPNSARAARRRARLEQLQQEDDSGWSDFTLF